MSCDLALRCFYKTPNSVSIARRRLVVLRLDPYGMKYVLALSFNRPKAISCLATQISKAWIMVIIRVSIARRRLVVLRPSCCSAAGWSATCFNRPKAISCLATYPAFDPNDHSISVSIARRRLVVLRLGGADLCDPLRAVSIARRRLVVLRLREWIVHGGAETGVSIARRRLVVLRPTPRIAKSSSDSTFQSPEGD